MNKLIYVGLGTGLLSLASYYYYKKNKLLTIPHIEPTYTIARRIVLNDKKILELGVNNGIEYFRIKDHNEKIITSSHKVLNVEIGVNRLEYFLEDNYNLTFTGSGDSVILLIKHNDNVANLFTINRNLNTNKYKTISMSSENLDKLQQLFN